MKMRDVRPAHKGVKHTAVYGAFRKALEALGDWFRPVAGPHLAGVGTNACPECMTIDAHLPGEYRPYQHNVMAENCRKSALAGASR